VKRSAGILLFRRAPAGVQVLLAHPGGPFWARRDQGAWTIPKGGIDEGEEPLIAARREFIEETGVDPGNGGIELTPCRQSGGKTILAWAIEGDCDAGAVHSNDFEMEWPPRSGRIGRFPEIDRAEWFTLEEARRKIIGGQAPLLDELERRLSSG
jgi:predicted NUDIX family NTP pyrophosphohydrolase